MKASEARNWEIATQIAAFQLYSAGDAEGAFWCMEWCHDLMEQERR